MRNINWPNLKGYNDPSQAYDSFLNEYTAVYNSCFPLKKQTVKRGTLNEPWLSKGLLESISKKNKLYKRYLRNPSPQNEIENVTHEEYIEGTCHGIPVVAIFGYARHVLFGPPSWIIVSFNSLHF